MGRKEAALPLQSLPSSGWAGFGGPFAFWFAAGPHLLYFEQMLAALWVFAAVFLPLMALVFLLALGQRGLVRLADWLLALPSWLASLCGCANRRGMNGIAARCVDWMEKWARTRVRGTDWHLPDHRRVA